jgi:hypothetical protein
MGQPQILFDNGFHLARRDGVKIKHVGDLDFHRVRKRVVEINVAHTLI